MNEDEMIVLCPKCSDLLGRRFAYYQLGDFDCERCGQHFVARMKTDNETVSSETKVQI